jgi:hypothetical protein
MAKSMAVGDENVVMTAEELAVARDMGMLNEDKPHGPVKVVEAPKTPIPITPKYRRILVCGSRSHWEFDLISGFVLAVLEKYPDAELFISGGGKGVDSIAAWILKNKLDKKVARIEAQWDKLDRGAGFARNWQMIMRCDAVAALWDGESKGTKQTMDAAKRMGKPVYEWTVPAVPEPPKNAK